jgi:hypothetical protein
MAGGNLKPSPYEQARQAINAAIEEIDQDPTVTAYMIVRLCLLGVANHQGNFRAAEMAYKLGDELATVGAPK